MYLQCPNEGGHIRQTDGCPYDTDLDGIKDCVSDLAVNANPGGGPCVFDPLKATFTPECCNIEADECYSDTPSGAAVSSSTYTNTLGETILPGCTSDTDMDGVVDGVDQCPDTTQAEIDLYRDAATRKKVSIADVGETAGCVILDPQVWEAIFLDMVVGQTPTDISSTTPNPDIQLSFAIDGVLPSIQAARLNVNVDNLDSGDVTRVRILDRTCSKSFDDTTVQGDELIQTTITLYESGSTRAANSLFTGQLPPGTVELTVDVGFDPDTIMGSPLWSLPYPFSTGRIEFCCRLELMSKDGGECIQYTDGN